MERSSRNHETTPVMRGAIVAMHKAGTPSEDIARQLKVCKKTVQKWIRRYVEGRSLATRPRSGPRCTTPHQDAAIVAEVISNPHTSSTKIKAALDFHCSGATIRRRLREAGIRQRLKEAGISHHISATKSHLASDVGKIRDRDARPARDSRDLRGLERERDRERDRDRDRDCRNNVPPMKRDPRGKNFPGPDKDFRSLEPIPGTNAVPSHSASQLPTAGPLANRPIPPALSGSDQEMKSKNKTKKKAIKHGNLMTKQDEAKYGVFVFQGILIEEEEIKLEKFEDEIKEEVIDFEEEEVLLFREEKLRRIDVKNAQTTRLANNDDQNGAKIDGERCASPIMQVLQLSDEQIRILPPEQQSSIHQLKDQINFAFKSTLK